MKAYDTYDLAKKMLKQQKNKQIRKNIVGMFASIIVFCTVYALILPAITMEEEYKCGKDEHSHIDACYGIVEEDVQLSCTLESLGCHKHEESCAEECQYADFLIHTHTKECYDPNYELICSLEEVHTHEHTEECYLEEKYLVCEHTEDDMHNEECYEVQQICACEQDEIVMHVHESSCYQADVLNCGKVELKEHIHDESCYQKVEQEPKELLCTFEEHVHTEECKKNADEDTAALMKQPKANESDIELAAEGDFNSEQIPTGSAGDYYHSKVYPVYQVSTYSFRKGMKKYSLETFVLVPYDEYSEKEWTPDYTPWTMSEPHNYEVTYCADYDHEVSEGTSYIHKTTLVEAGFSEADQQRMDVLMENAYPFITESEMRGKLLEAGYTGTFEASEMIAGVQMAVWKITDNVNLTYQDNKLQTDNSVALLPFSAAGKGGWDAATAIRDFLLNDAKSDTLSIANAEWKTNEDGTQTIVVTLNRSIQEGEMLTATLTDGVNVVNKNLIAGVKQFEMDWTAEITDEASLKLKIAGTVNKAKAYYYDDGGNKQNMVGAERSSAEISIEKVVLGSFADIEVEKVWNDNGTNRPTQIEVSLLKNESVLETVILNSENGWKYAWTNLPRIQGGKAISYSVREKIPEGYSVDISSKQSENEDGNIKTLYTITNTRIEESKQTSVSVVKKWADGNEKHSQDSITVRLLADGKDTGRVLTLNETNNWSGIFSGLAYYASDGETVIDYTVKEEAVIGYLASYKETEVAGSLIWEEASTLVSGGVYRFVSGDYALATNGSSLQSVSNNSEDTSQWWTATSNGGLQNVETGKYLGFSSSLFSGSFNVSNSEADISLTSNKSISCSGTWSTYYLRVNSSEVDTVSSSSSATKFTVLKQTMKMPQYQVEITNEMTLRPELPATGGIGTTPIIMSGIGLVILASTGLIMKKKKKAIAD